MAFSGFIDDNLSAKDVRSKMKSTVSPKKFVYEKGTTPEALKKYGDEAKKALSEAVTVPYGSPEYQDMIGNLPVYISADHQATFLPIGSNPFTHPATASLISKREKASVIPNAQEWKKDGWTHAMRAMRTPSGETPKAADEAPEWDYHTLFSLSRTEMSRLTEEEVATLIDITVDEIRQSQFKEYNEDEKTGKVSRNPTGHGKGYKEAFIFPLHTDTDNFHVQGFVNRHPWNVEEKISGAAEYKASIFANFRENVNRRLADAGIDLVIGSNVQAVFDTRAEASDVEAAIEALQEEGLDVHPEMTTGQIQQNGKVASKVASKSTFSEEEYDVGLVELNKDLIDLKKQEKLILERIRLTQDAKKARSESNELNARIELLEGEKAALIEDNAILSDHVAAVEEEKTALTEKLGATAAELADKTEELTSTKQELTSVSSELAVESEKVMRLEDQNDRLEATVSQLTSRLEKFGSVMSSVWASRHQWFRTAKEQAIQIAGLTKTLDEVKTTAEAAQTELETRKKELEALAKSNAEIISAKDDFESQAKDLGEAVERLIAEKNQLNASLQPMQSTLALYERMAAGAEVEDDIEPAGIAIRAMTTDNRKKKPQLPWPDNINVKKHFLSSKKTITLSDNVTQLVTGVNRNGVDYITVPQPGKYTDEAIDVALLHAQREGWDCINTADIPDPKVRARIEARAEELGMSIEGKAYETAFITRGDPNAPVADETKTDVAPADQTPQPAKTSATNEKGVATWVVNGVVSTDDEKRSLERAFKYWRHATKKQAAEIRTEMQSVTDDKMKRELEKKAIVLENRVENYTQTDYLEYRHKKYLENKTAAEWRTRDPKDWSEGQRKAASEALKAWKEDGKNAGVSLDEYGTSSHAKWRKENPEEAAKLDAEKGKATKPNPPKPE